ncbi:hypothetical protein [Paenibacillus sp. IHBB 10380]|uniref:hypothetical protein n=1 Tax=Paenibacillus sp. IHBB 10380 TaxID=1566358 RepID=UPI0005CFD664|nr:hypothetical protein [Paenibacillus sp. IHBB 10380]AJS58659.1 hypothetical protein UB51_09355 [Paenibacillus sp. IHBB 10380]
MGVRIAEVVNRFEQLEFYLVELEYFDDFEIVLGVLKDDSCDIVDVIEGIYSRIADCNKNGVEFNLVYHEDVGIYIYSKIQSEYHNQFIKDYIISIIPNIEKLLSV